MKNRILYVVIAGSAACLSACHENASDSASTREEAVRRVDITATAPEASAITVELPNMTATPQSSGYTEASGDHPTSATTPSAAATEASAPAAHAPLTRAEIVRRARLVQAEADWKVARMDSAVNLSDEQASSAFVAYAQASSAYDPGIPIEIDGQTVAVAAAGGSGSGSADAQVYGMLDEEQQAAFGQEMLNRDLWWTEIIAQLAADFPESTATTATEAVQPSAHQVDNIFDILNPAN